MNVAFVTSLRFDSSSDSLKLPLVDSRTFGYFVRLEDAVESVNKNIGDLRECLYDYVVIEQINQGIHGETEKELWFGWNYELNCWFPRPKPSELVGIVNFALG